MAGIGFELRKLLRKEGYGGLLQGYGYAGVISSGPWVLSILGMFIIGLVSLPTAEPKLIVSQFQVSVTNLIAVSLIATGALQLGFTRFIADRVFERRDDAVLPNFFGILFVVTLMSGGVGILSMLFLFSDESVAYWLVMTAGFVVLCDIWIATTVLSGIRRYKAVVATFAIGYLVSVAMAIAFRPFGLEGLLLGFLTGQLVLLIGMIILVVRSFPSDRFIEFECLRPGRLFKALLWTGFMINFGVWADKLIFWYYPHTSEAVIGALRASSIYDPPIFLAYLSIIPGMAVFLVRIETDFVEYYHKFYGAIREGGSLERIEEMRNAMVYTIRHGIFDIIKIQVIACLVAFVAGPALLQSLGIPQRYLPLLYVDLVAAGLQVVLLGLLNVLFYLDRRREVALVSAVLLVGNIVLTFVSLQLGPAFYGYGFAFGLLAAVILGMALLDRKLDVLEYETFMLQ